MARATTPSTPKKSAPAHEARHTPDLSLEARLEQGKAARNAVSRSAQALWKPADDRPDAIKLLQQRDAKRLPELVPIRYGRMTTSLISFMRGSAILMANDLASTPSTGITPQICGDAHLLNFGVYATPERNLVFGLNDFDETLPGPWEWDVKRLSASFVAGGRDNKLSDAFCEEAVESLVRSYQTHIAEYARMSYLDVWFARVDDAAILSMLPKQARDRSALKPGEGRGLRQLSKLTTIVDGQPRIADDPPLLTHASDARIGDQLGRLLAGYLDSLNNDRRALLERYTLKDFALKVVGIGSVGTRCYVMLFQGLDEHDVLLLQIKESDASVLEAHLGQSAYAQHGERVVQGQRLMQAASDLFLGWGRAGSTDYYIRQLPDLKGTVNLAEMTPATYMSYADVCGWALARAHARSGEAARISGYLGRRDVFAHAMCTFAFAYADQTERDYETLLAAIKDGRIKAEMGV